MRASRWSTAGASPVMAAIAGVALAACSSSSASASHSPAATASAAASPSPSAAATASPSPSPTPTPALVGSYGVLVTPLLNTTSYTVSIVDIDGKVVASAQASSPPTVTCGGTAAAVLPLPVSTSNSRVYYMDAQGVVRFLTPGGATGQATTLPIGVARRSVFAVSPDDLRIAVTQMDFTTGGASTQLYVEDLTGGGNRVTPYNQSGSYILWPTGWHGTNNLVVAKVPACTQGGGPLCCGPQELHVVDPATFTRRFTLGGPSCVIGGDASPAGVVCEVTTFTSASVLNWTAITQRSIAIQGPTAMYLSPDGSYVAVPDFGTATTAVDGANKTLAMQACAWIDATHLLAGGDTQQQPRVGDVTSGTILPVAAQGDCGGRIPGGL